MIPDSLFTSTLRLANQTLLNLKPAEIQRLPAPKAGKEYMLYAHVPFCETLCTFCSFNRYVYDENSARAYFAALRDEMRAVASLGYRFGSMYVGGGTPTIMVDELNKTIDLARELFGVREVSCETNPNHLAPRLADQLGGRVQRLSVGVQSFDDDLLKKVNRFHRFGSGADILARLQSVAGLFDSLNVDMIYNFPTQDEAVLRRDIAMLVASGTNQTTFYPLMTSPSVDRVLRNTVGQVTHDREEAYYHLVVEELSRHFDLSTAWTFSRQGNRLIDEYIVDYEEYVGVGSGSFSYLDGMLLVNTFSLKDYRERIGNGVAPVTGMRRFSDHERMWYRFMMDLFGLRLDKTRFLAEFGRSIEAAMPIEMAYFAARGAFAENNEEAITLTPRGRYMLVVMMREFFSGINRIRDQARRTGEAVCETPSPGLYSYTRPSA